MSPERIQDHFEEQANWCDHFGSSLTASLCRAFGADYVVNGPVRHILSNWKSDPRSDALALRLAGALHAAALSGKNSELAALYRTTGGSGDVEAIIKAGLSFMTAEPDWVRSFIQSAPQTNETRRAIALLVGYLAVAARHDLPLDILELGASAGLNQNFDKFRYQMPEWSWGPATSPVKLDTKWTGPLPEVSAPLNVRHRAACDLNPLDLSNPEQLLQLKSYIWPDQPERHERFDGAVAIALAEKTKVERADASKWLEEKLAARKPGAVTVVAHTIFFQYPPLEARRRMAALIEQVGEAATADVPLAWVRFEPESVFGDVDALQLILDVRLWPGNHHIRIANVDAHLRYVEAFERDA